MRISVHQCKEFRTYEHLNASIGGPEDVCIDGGLRMFDKLNDIFGFEKMILELRLVTKTMEWYRLQEVRERKSGHDFGVGRSLIC